VVPISQDTVPRSREGNQITYRRAAVGGEIPACGSVVAARKELIIYIEILDSVAIYINAKLLVRRDGLVGGRVDYFSLCRLS
jgi:hypothetical protein